jgi:hypothetical protein
MNSPLTPVSGLRADRRAIVAHFVVRRKISHKAIWDFFNSIGAKRTFKTRTSGKRRKTELAKHRDQHPSAILRADRPANPKAKEVKPMLTSETRSGVCAMQHKATSQSRIKLVNDHLIAMPNDACLGQRRNLTLQLSLGSFTRFENAQTAEFALLLTANTFSRGNLSGTIVRSGADRCSYF